MIVRFGVLRRREGLDAAGFQRHWQEVHAPLVRTVPGILHYTQNAVVVEAAPEAPRRGPAVDGISQLWFADAAAMRTAMASPEHAACIADVETFVGAISAFSAEPIVVVPRARDAAPAYKRLTVFARVPGLDDATLRHRWCVEHVELARRFQGLVGYTQNLVHGQGGGTSGRLEAVPIAADGFVELWFESREAAERNFASPAGRAASAHGLGFAGRAATFAIDERPIF